MFNRLVFLAMLLATAGLIVIMNFFAPMDMGPLGVLLFFTMAYIVLFGLSLLLVRIFVAITGKGGLMKRDYLYAAIIALGPLMLLMVQSFGSLSFWTIGLVVVFEFLACFMVKKVTSS